MLCQRISAMVRRATTSAARSTAHQVGFWGGCRTAYLRPRFAAPRHPPRPAPEPVVPISAWWHTSDIGGHGAWREGLKQRRSAGAATARRVLWRVSLLRPDAGDHAGRVRVHVPKRRGHAHTPDIKGPLTYSVMADRARIAYLEVQVSGRVAHWLERRRRGGPAW